jgi:hypothetical protein
MLRIIGLAFAALGALTLALDLAGTAGSGLRLRALGEWWARLDRDSLQLAQPAIERHVSPFLWDPIALNVLLTPAALLFLGLGVAFLLLARFRRRDA